MLISLKRRRIATERQAAVPRREQAARDFVAALREAQAALETMRSANDQLYRAPDPNQQSTLNDLRQARERMFIFHACAEVIAEAPLLARMTGTRIGSTRAMPLIEWINHISKHDLAAAGDVISKGNEQ